MTKTLNFSKTTEGSVDPSVLLDVYKNLLDLYENHKFVPISMADQFSDLVEAHTGKTISDILEEEVG